MKGTEKPPIDWDAVKARLSTVIAATDAGFSPSPERAKAILDERARSLAVRPPRMASAAGVLLLAVFAIGRDRFGIDARNVYEVVRLADLTPIPSVPRFLAGVTNYRGEILAVLHLGEILGTEAAAPGRLAYLIVLGTERAELGVLASEAGAVTEVSLAELVAAPSRTSSESTAGAHGAYLRGVTADGTLVLDASALLDDPRFFVNQADEPGNEPREAT